MSSVAETSSPMSRTAFFSFSSGIFVVLATLVAVALLNLPKTAGAAVAMSDSCPMTEVSLDQGYGVSRTAYQPVCREATDQAASGNTLAR